MADMRHTRRRRARSVDVLGKLRAALALAESDPARFRAECAAAASRLGVGVEELYQLVEANPEFKRALREKAVNAAVTGVARFARRALGL
jgi:hypothetical protein